MKITFGQRLRNLRQEKELSLRALAEKLGGITAPYLSDIELGRRYPSDELLEKMARVLRVPVDELRSLDPRPPVEELRERGLKDPKFAFALRQVVDQKITGEELVRMVEKLKKDER